MEITIDKQNLSPRIKKTGTLVYSELTNTLFIKSKNKGVMQIGSSVDTSNFVEKSTTIEINGVAQDLSTNRTWTIFVPTKTSELTNDSGFLTSSDLSSYLTISSAAATYQPILVSGTTIKTINGISILGSGNISVSSSPVLTTGSIPFSNGSTLTENNSNLFWDNTNKRLGIGTASPVCSFVLNAPDAEVIPVRIQKTNGDLRFYISAGSGGSSIISFARGGSLWGIGSRVNYSDAFLISTLGDLSGSTHAVRIEKSSRNIGLSLPNAPATATLHIRAGTATAGSAPLKFTAGTNLTTPENGAFEFDGTNLYFTVGGVRKIVSLI